MKKTKAYYLVNAVTWYRLIAAPFLVVLVIAGNLEWFKWLLAFSFFTDAIDGFLARRFKVVSRFGARLDSAADDFTILVCIIAVIIVKTEFILKHQEWVFALFMLYLFQLVLALVRYGKPTSFHTYLAKIAAVLQGSFFILLFFLEEPPMLLFYVAALITMIDIMEEIIIVFMLKQWKADVKGIYWLMNPGK